MRAGVGLLLRWVRGTEWRWFLDFATPAFFDVMPLGALTSQMKGLVRAAADGNAFRRARTETQRVLAARGIEIRIISDDEPRFAAGIAALGLEGAAPVLRDHFGAGDQRAVQFRTDDFRARFHEVFVRCRDAGQALHPGFVPLGIALACLYDGLEALDVPLDVRDAFERASRSIGALHR